mgnify:CR=1 FL=1
MTHNLETYKIKKLYTGEEILENQEVIIQSGKIKSVISLDKVDNDLIMIPGFIDIHNHGGYGIDYLEHEEENYERLQVLQASEGITSLVATLGLSSKEATFKALDKLSDYIKNQNTKGAKIIGIHLEGPFVSKEKGGAMDESLAIDPDLALMEEFIDRSDDNISIVTLAPELDGAMNLIEFLNERGIIPSAGHTNAEEVHMVDAHKHGLRQVTHLFNAMRGFHHRDIGIVGETLTNPDIYAEMVGCDGLSINPKAWKLAFTMKGPEKMVIATDALILKGLPNGEYEWMGRKMRFEDGFAYTDYHGANRLPGKPMTFPGSIKNIMKFTGASIEDIVIMSAVNPAKRLGIDHHKGKIKASYDADFNIINKDFDIIDTIIGGKSNKEDYEKYKF